MKDLTVMKETNFLFIQIQATYMVWKCANIFRMVDLKG